MDTFGAHGTLQVGSASYRIARLSALADRGIELGRLPYALRILLENLLRREDGRDVTAADIEALARWQPNDKGRPEIAFMPARVLLQDFTGVPAVVDLAAMRDAMAAMGGDPSRINPLQPVELVIDHSVQIDEYGQASALAFNADKEYQRNQERYGFLRWGQGALENFKVVPPSTGIVHQVNLEFLARGVMARELDGASWAYPDTLVGTDSHTTMINGLGVLGWGVGGIEAEAAMLGQPVAMLIPDVVGMKLSGKLPEGCTATDLVLTVTERLRAHGVVGKFVEFFGPGLAELPLADRATIANMAPEYGATCGIFPMDEETLSYLAFSGRSTEQVDLARAYMAEQGLLFDANTPEAEYTDRLELDLSTIEPSLAGPSRPQDRIVLSDMKSSFASTVAAHAERRGAAAGAQSFDVEVRGREGSVSDGAVVIASITSCTNTSNPSVMLAAGLVAKKAAERGLSSKPWVKTSLAPGSQVVADYLERAQLIGPLEQLGFHVVGFGCTTCIGNSGPLPGPVDAAVREGDLCVASVLSGNRNFEGRVHQNVRASYLASPPLVVAYALAGRVDLDLTTEPIGTDANGQPVMLSEIWPSPSEVAETLSSALTSDMFRARYDDVYAGDERWQSMPAPEGSTFAWDEASTYVRHAPYFQNMPAEPAEVTDIAGARCLALLGDSITTDHISPAGAIKADSPAGRYLQSCGVDPTDFNSYGSRRGNHEVMMRGTFANVRLRNLLVPGVEGGETRHFPSDEPMSIYDAAMRYKEEGVPLVILAGKEYGTGSSRDWAAKGPALQGVRAVVAQSYERIHRSNLIGMGVLPLQFREGESAQSLGLSGEETFEIRGLAALMQGDYRSGQEVEVQAGDKTFHALVRIDTPAEADYYKNGGILQYVLRRLLAS